VREKALLEPILARGRWVNMFVLHAPGMVYKREPMDVDVITENVEVVVMHHKSVHETRRVSESWTLLELALLSVIDE
jgi:hypothetical protein